MNVEDRLQYAYTTNDCQPYIYIYTLINQSQQRSLLTIILMSDHNYNVEM